MNEGGRERTQSLPVLASYGGDAFRRFETPGMGRSTSFSSVPTAQRRTLRERSAASRRRGFFCSTGSSSDCRSSCPRAIWPSSMPWLRRRRCPSVASCSTCSFTPARLGISLGAPLTRPSARRSPPGGWSTARAGFRAPRNSAEVRSRCGMQHVELDLDAQTVAFARDGVQLDLGGIGKGYAADLIAARLRELGAEAGVAERGRGELRALECRHLGAATGRLFVDIRGGSPPRAGEILGGAPRRARRDVVVRCLRAAVCSQRKELRASDRSSDRISGRERSARRDGVDRTGDAWRRFVDDAVPPRAEGARAGRRRRGSRAGLASR